MTPDPPLRRALTLLVLSGIVCVLYATRPRLAELAPDAEIEPGTKSCLSNLRQIGRAYAMYGLDYNGKLPRGVDPEDRANSVAAAKWRSRSDGVYDPGRTPFLHEVLRPYVASREVFHCPSDVGWERTRLSQLGRREEPLQIGLRNIRPSSFARFGTSYYGRTKYAFGLNTAADIPKPAEKVLLFDGDLWHRSEGRDSLNGLFADGHVQTLTLAQFRAYSRD